MPTYSDESSEDSDSALQSGRCKAVASRDRENLTSHPCPSSVESKERWMILILCILIPDGISSGAPEIDLKRNERQARKRKVKPSTKPPKIKAVVIPGKGKKMQA